MTEVDPPGTHLGKYEIVSYSTANAVCIEYTCLDRERARPALLKVLRPELLASEAAHERFAQIGADWLELGAHPHIVCCREVLRPENSDQIYLVLPATISESQRDTPSLLSWLLPGQPLPVIQALLFALQIVRGMQYVTTRRPGFVHGDLKPQNIIVGAGWLSQANVNRLRVTDFGLASVLLAADTNQRVLEETSVGQTQIVHGAVGTPLYMPFEQWHGETSGAATDIYALGCMLYEMLVGRHPVAGETTQRLRNDHCAGNIRPLPFTLPEAIRHLTTRCLALESKERYQSWDELENAMVAVYGDTTHYPPPALEPTDTPTQSERVQEGWFLNVMGSVAAETGNVDTAVECLGLALKRAEEEGAP